MFKNMISRLIGIRFSKLLDVDIDHSLENSAETDL